MTVNKELKLVLITTSFVLNVVLLILLCFFVLRDSPSEVNNAYKAGEKYARLLCEDNNMTNCDSLVLGLIDYGNINNAWAMTFYGIDAESQTRWVGHIGLDDDLKEQYSTSDKEQCKTIQGTDCLL